jgi:hypothetical protein
MADTFKILGQAALAATTSTAVYTVPASTSTTVSSVTICNRGTTPCSFRLSTAIAGAALANAQYIYYDQPLDPNSTFVATLGVTLATTDVIRAYASTANVSVNVFGVEVT